MKEHRIPAVDRANHAYCEALSAELIGPIREAAHGRMNSALIEFEDGVRHIVSRWAVRRAGWTRTQLTRRRPIVSGLKSRHQERLPSR
ncbi:MAG: hypothetical protein RQ833_07505 [Sphingomonadaceae bacterium]|nr:hypothetical protein [Sphingomonadaceae bacterium]